MPTETDILAELPSKGKFYNNFKEVRVIPLLFEDEQRILISKNKGSNPVNEIISKCIKGVNLSDLIPIDKLYLLLKIKEVSYGPEYKFNIICPECETNVNTTLDVTKHISINYIEDDLEDPREINLPMLKIKAKVRFPRVREEEYFSDVDSALANLYRFVVSLDGNENPVFIAKAMKKMHIKDLKTLNQAINRSDLGVDPRFNFECPHCKHNQIMRVPFDANFFSMN